MLAGHLRAEPDVLVELNAMNANLPAGRLWIDPAGELVVGTEVSFGSLAELPNMVEAIGRAAVGVSAFLGGLLQAGGGNDEPGHGGDSDG